MFGLSESTYEFLQGLFNQYKAKVEQVVIYGSRALGTQRNGSDIDLCIKGAFSEALVLELMRKIDESSIPHKVDLSVYHRIENVNLKKHIDELGKPFWPKEGV